MKKPALVLAVTAVAVLSAAGGYLVFRSISNINQQSSGQSTFTEMNLIGMERPDFSLPDVYGKERHLEEWDGNVVVINFWATWCPPCRDEIPEFIALQKTYADSGLQFLGIALQKAQDVMDYINELGVNYPVLVGEAPVIDIARSFGNHMGALPYTVVIDRESRIIFIKKGPLSREEIEPIIRSLL